MLKPTEPTSAERSSAEVFVTGGNASPDAPACDAVFAGFPLFSGGSPFPEGLVLPDDAPPAAPPSFADFALGVYPFLEFEPFHRAYYRVLEAFAAGRVRRLIVTMPPQHGKSVGGHDPAPGLRAGTRPPTAGWRSPPTRGRWPRSSTAACGASSNRRNTRPFSGHLHQAGAKPPGYIRTADEVEIIGRRGGLLSVGREGSLTGNRVDCFVLDDLYRK